MWLVKWHPYGINLLWPIVSVNDERKAIKLIEAVEILTSRTNWQEDNYERTQEH